MCKAVYSKEINNTMDQIHRLYLEAVLHKKGLLVRIGDKMTRIYVVDDEYYMRKAIEQALSDNLMDSEIISFSMPKILLETFRKEPCDIAFIDIEMPGMTGIELAERLMEIKPDCNIYFLTAYDEYKAMAMDLRVCDYIMKPITKEKVNESLKYLRYPLPKNSTEIRAITFGNFALYVDKKVVTFHRRKSAELLAYLIDRCGTVVTRAELTLVLFEDETHSRESQKYLDSVYRTLLSDLKAVGAECILYKGTNGLAVNRTLLSSDLFDYLEGETTLYNGEYMKQYSWGEHFQN